MDIYKILKLFTKIKSRRIKLLGLWTMHVTGRRYIGVFLDPVMACNLRCRMCYMSDPEKAQPSLPRQGRLEKDTLDYISSTLFPRALKLQIGCATEPTLYPDLANIIRKAKEQGVPYISITTNGQLLTAKSLNEMLEAGLNEVTLSVHGLERRVYEDMMRGASFDKFLNLMKILREAQKRFPDFKVRINYVMNADNTLSLANLYDVLDGVKLDVLQLRPIQKLGETDYSDFSLDVIKENYDRIIKPIRERCAKEGTVCLCPTKENLDALESEYDPMVDYVEKLTYYYVTDAGVNKPDFNWKEEDFRHYHRRKGTAREIWKSIWHWEKKADDRHSSRKLNYTVD